MKKSRDSIDLFSLALEQVVVAAVAQKASVVTACTSIWNVLHEKKKESFLRLSLNC